MGDYTSQNHLNGSPDSFTPTRQSALGDAETATSHQFLSQGNSPLAKSKGLPGAIAGGRIHP